MYKQLFLTLFLLIFCTPSWSETLTMDDLVERNNLYYKKFTNTPFNGEVSGIKSGSFKKGRKNGEWFIYYKNGQLKEKRSYKDGIENGLAEYYYESGQLRSKSNFIKGQKDGLWEYFNEDDSLKETQTWKNGVKQ